MRSTPPFADNSSALDWTPDLMLARLDGDLELAQQLAVIFVDEYPTMIQRLRDAVSGGSADDIRRAAHAIKGSISNFVDGGPTATAFELENMGRNVDLQNVGLVLERLEREIVGLADCLRKFHSGESR